MKGPLGKLFGAVLKNRSGVMGEWEGRDEVH